MKGSKGSASTSVVMLVLPFALFVGLWIVLSRRMQTGGSGLGKFGRSKARRVLPDSPKITFRDVAGV